MATFAERTPVMLGEVWHNPRKKGECHLTVTDVIEINGVTVIKAIENDKGYRIKVPAEEWRRRFVPGVRPE